MAAQLALFPGLVPIVEQAQVQVAPEPPAELAAEPTPLSLRQMGLFDEQVRRLRVAVEAVAAGDLLRAISLLEQVSPDLDPGAPTLRRRVAEIHGALEHLGGASTSDRVAVHLELGRSMAAETEPWVSLGRMLVARAASELGPTESMVAARLLLEARHPLRARAVLLAAAGSPNAAALFALGDVELALGDRSAARRCYCDALLLDPFDPSFDCVADEEVCGLPYLAEFEVEVDGSPRAWAAPVGIVAGILPRPREPSSMLPMPAGATGDSLALLVRARQFVEALARAARPDAQRDRDALLEARRSMKRASAPLFRWYMARQAGSTPRR